MMYPAWIKSTLIALAVLAGFGLLQTAIAKIDGAF